MTDRMTDGWTDRHSDSKCRASVRCNRRTEGGARAHNVAQLSSTVSTTLSVFAVKDINVQSGRPIGAARMVVIIPT